jgi:hypothetical protein
MGASEGSVGWRLYQREKGKHVDDGWNHDGDRLQDDRKVELPCYTQAALLARLEVLHTTFRQVAALLSGQQYHRAVDVLDTASENDLFLGDDPFGTVEESHLASGTSLPLAHTVLADQVRLTLVREKIENGDVVGARETL